MTTSLRTFRELRLREWIRRGVVGLVAGVLLFSWTGCGSAPKLPPVAKEPEPQLLRAGDVIRVSFPGTPALESTQQIRRDGKINLEIVGEVSAAEKTPAELEKELSTLFGPNLVNKEVKVTVVSSSFSVFVTGAVMRPGKVQVDRPLTAFEAIMEAGGFDMERANTKAVVVIRHENGTNTNYKLNLKTILDGKPTTPFQLKAFDTVYVPEKFQWF